MKRILLYPGTFNPPHLGHAAVVEAALKTVDFDEVWVLPSGKRLDKEIPTSPEDRKNLARVFVEHLNSSFSIPVSLITDALDDDSKYVHEHIVDIKSRPGYEVCQLTGIDGFLAIKERVIGPNEKFVVHKRPGYDFPPELLLNQNITTIVVEEETGSISSTQIREMVKNREKSYKKYVPAGVAAYIERRHLYL